MRMDRVDGGVVYRGVLESDYNISTLEPVIVGSDATDEPEDADDALRNVDNVYVMDDGRVLCCEDGFGGPGVPQRLHVLYEPRSPTSWGQSVTATETTVTETTLATTVTRMATAATGATANEARRCLAIRLNSVMSAPKKRRW